MNWSKIQASVLALLSDVPAYLVEKAEWYHRKDMSGVKDLELVVPFELYRLITPASLTTIRAAYIAVLRSNGFKETPYVRMFGI